jgi:hypothetical protein
MARNHIRATCLCVGLCTLCAREANGAAAESVAPEFTVGAPPAVAITGEQTHAEHLGDHKHPWQSHPSHM